MLMISDSDEDTQFSWWREELWLHMHNEIILLSGEELTDNTKKKNAVQTLLNRRFSEIVGFQDTIKSAIFTHY